MKTYRVKVNGKLFEVELEAVSETKGSISAPEAKKEEPTPVSGSGTVNAPVAGKLLSLKVKVGEMVKKGDVIGVIEAMKLENEVPSPIAGKVVAINAKVGDVVNNGDVLVTLG